MSKELTGRRYRLEPTPAQERELRQTLGAVRWLWNSMLEYREVAWLAARAAGATGIATNLGYVHLCSVLTHLKSERPWLSTISNIALRGALRNLDIALARYFAGVSAFPHFKSRGGDESVTYAEPERISVDRDWVRLPKLGWIRFRLHRPLNGSVRTATVSFESGHWYVSFCVAGCFTLPNAGQSAVAVDAGVAQSVCLSTGEPIAFPVATAKEERRLRFFQRQAARRQKGSNRRRGSLTRVAQLRARIAHRRRDAAHKLSTRLATTHAAIVIEDLRIKNLTRSARGTAEAPGKNVAIKARLNHSLLANGHGDFRRMLAYKCERSGAHLIPVNPAFTSQTCSQCGHVAYENRKSQAVFQCVACGANLNADHNAALNILAAGLAVPAQGGSGIVPASELRTRSKVRRVERAIPAENTDPCVLS